MQLHLPFPIIAYWLGITILLIVIEEGTPKIKQWLAWPKHMTYREAGENRHLPSLFWCNEGLFEMSSAYWCSNYLVPSKKKWNENTAVRYQQTTQGKEHSCFLQRWFFQLSVEQSALPKPLNI